MSEVEKTEVEEKEPTKITKQDFDFSNFELLKDCSESIQKIQQITQEVDEIRGMGIAVFEDLALAKAKVIIRAEVERNAKMIMSLVGSPLGFKTDKDSYDSGYAPAVIFDCATEALIQGFRLTGNQFNIIVGNMYGCKNGFFQKLLSLQDGRKLSWRLIHSIGTPVDESEKLWDLTSKIIWSADGKEEREQEMNWIIAGGGFKTKYDKKAGKKLPVLDLDGNRQPVTTQDQLRGKADRKCYHWLFTTLTGMYVPDVDDAAPIDLNDAPENKTIFDGAKKDTPKPEAEPIEAEVTVETKTEPLPEEKPVEEAKPKEDPQSATSSAPSFEVAKDAIDWIKQTVEEKHKITIHGLLTYLRQKKLLPDTATSYLKVEDVQKIADNLEAHVKAYKDI